MPVIGILDVGTDDRSAKFLQGLADAGYVERRNVAIELRSAAGRVERYPDLVADLVR